jgi:hypothetical protein
MQLPDLRATLADNIGRRIDADTPKGARKSVRAWAIARGLQVKMIDRLLKGQHAVTLDTLDEVAKAIGVQPWQLLLPDLPTSGVSEAPITNEERALLERLKSILTK